MNTVLINSFDEEKKKQSLVSNIEIQMIEYSPLVIAKKKIIVPENKIIVERFKPASSYQYQPVVGEEYGRTSTGIILAR